MQISTAGIYQRVQQLLGVLFRCEQAGDLLRIRTPFLYPDGDVIDIFCRSSQESVEFTDLGETARWLHMQTHGTRRSIRQAALIHAICSDHGLEFRRGELFARARPDDDPADVLIRMVAAALRVSGIWYASKS